LVEFINDFEGKLSGSFFLRAGKTGIGTELLQSGNDTFVAQFA